MAGLKGMLPMFSMQAIRQQMEEQIQAFDKKSLEALQYEGNEFVTKARKTGNYDDQTGNLRSSIGYVILKDGKVIDQDFRLAGEGSDRETGRAEAMELVNGLSANFNKGLVLIGVAGMGYAAAVESLGYDVITGSAPNSNDVKDLLGAIEL